MFLCWITTSKATNKVLDTYTVANVDLIVISDDFTIRM